MSTAAKPYGDPSRSRLLYIGHDPRLQKSDTIAEYAFFADYYFRPKPTAPSEVKKYDLAAAMFQMVDWLTGGELCPEEVLVTNLCNGALPHAPKKTVSIPEDQAVHGVSELRQLLSGSSIQVVVATSLQVNYWLQQLGFCSANADFLVDARPRPTGLQSEPPFYQPTRKDRAFTRVCGQRFLGPSGIPVYPVLHVKQWSWPLKRSLLDAYGAAHERCRELVQQDLASAAITQEGNLADSPLSPTGLA